MVYMTHAPPGLAVPSSDVDVRQLYASPISVNSFDEVDVSPEGVGPELPAEVDHDYWGLMV
jgi:hypothetical protein